MSQEFKKCFQRGKITEFSPGKKIFTKELRIAGEDFLSAQKSFSEENYKWSIIQSYYSMFHSARSLIYISGYREKSHFCLIEAIRELYVEKGLLGVSLVEALLEAKNLREDADYYGDFSKINAEKLLKKATDFLDKARDITTKFITIDKV